MKHTIVALMENHPGVLNRVASLFRRRNFNIESLTVGHTDIPEISRMTIVVDGSETNVEQVTKQFHKLIEVIKISDVTEDKTVMRELALVKVTANRDTRAEIIQIVDVFRANIVDVATDSMIVEITGDEEKIESLTGLLRPFGIKEMVRTGRVAMVRGIQGATRLPGDEDEPRQRSNNRQNRRVAVEG